MALKEYLLGCLAFLAWRSGCMATGFVVHMSVPPCLPPLSGRSTGFVLPYLGLRRASVMEVPYQHCRFAAWNYAFGSPSSCLWDCFIAP